MSSQKKPLKHVAQKPSEFRQDLVTGDWVVIATGRARRPHAYAAGRPVVNDDIATCPFEDLVKSGNEKPVLTLKDKNGWTVLAVSNKYPALTHGNGTCPIEASQGLYRYMEGTGFHEVVILRDHYATLAELPASRIVPLIAVYRQRFSVLKKEPCINYISIFHNSGREAGATLTHPHSQLIALPVVPPDIARSIAGSDRYYLGEKKCVHCELLSYERKEKKRIVFENAHMIVMAPYASRSAFELRLFPKRHGPHFEEMTSGQEHAAAEALHAALWKLHKGLKNPAYNYFVHTAPTKGHQHDHYHWHIEIIPKTQIWAGFEIGTGIEISSIAPETAAAYLRSIK
ncbi:MAG: DUF4921 family protein [bacterium]|nr:DUF4921 family protein [bacterium]